MCQLCRRPIPRTATRRDENPEPFVVTCGYLPSGELWVNAKGQPVPVHLHVRCWDAPEPEAVPTPVDVAVAANVEPEPEPVAPRPGGDDGEQQTMF